MGRHQIPKVAEIKTAKIIKKPSGYYLYITCFIPKEKYIESWENTQTKKHNFKYREWVSFDKPIGIDFKPNGMESKKWCQMSRRGSKPDPFKEYIKERLEEYPELTATALFGELVERGYTGNQRYCGCMWFR